MKNIEHVSKERLEKAFELIRKDIALLHRDIAYAEGNKTRWIFIIIWIVLSNLIHDAFNLHFLYSFVISTALVGIYRIFDSLRIKRKALQSLKEPLEPMFDIRVDLS